MRPIYYVLCARPRCKWRARYNNIRHGRISNTGTSRSDKFIVIYYIIICTLEYAFLTIGVCHADVSSSARDGFFLIIVPCIYYRLYQSTTALQPSSVFTANNYYAYEMLITWCGMTTQDLLTTAIDDHYRLAN